MIALILVLGLLSAQADDLPELEKERRGVHWGLLPIANYSTDRGLMLGGLTQRFDYAETSVRPFRTLITAQASYATQGERILYMGFDQVRPELGGLRSSLEIQTLANPSQRYYGLGDGTSRDSLLESEGFNFYRYEEFLLRGSLRHRVAPKLDLLTGLGLVGSRYRPSRSDSLFARDFGGESRPVHYLRGTLGVVYEGRDFEFITSDGSYAAATFTFAPGFGPNAAVWTRLDLNYRRYDPILRSRWLWLASEVRYAHAEEDAPLVEKPRLGSLTSVRGLPLNRYLSNDSFSFRTELRSVFVRTRIFDFPLKGGLGLFADAGKIGTSPAALVDGELHAAAGFSVFGSYFTDDFLGSADFGFSRDGLALYLRLGHPF